VDLREVPEHPPVGMGYEHRKGSTVILTVGSDCNVGKMSTSLELDLLARKRGLKSTFVATGQTGIMIANSGIAVDRVISDFVNGAIEEIVLPAAEAYDWVWVEGQGSLFHPSYAAVSLALLHGSQPDLFVVCHQPGRERILGNADYPVPPIEAVIDQTIAIGRLTNPAIRCAGVSLNTGGLDAEEAARVIAGTSQRLGLPAADPIRGGDAFARLLDACTA